MALSESRLENKIVAILNACKTEELDPGKAKTKFSKELAKAIVEEIKLADVTGVCPQNAGLLTNGKIN